MARKKELVLPEPYDVKNDSWVKMILDLENRVATMDTPRYRTEKVVEETEED